MKQIDDTSVSSARKRFMFSLIMVGLAVIYTIAPIDLIPDVLLPAGLLDDIPLLITTAAYAGYTYRKMKKKQDRESS